MSETQTALCIMFLLLTPLAGGGLALMNAGLGRTRNAAHSMMAALCVIAVAACVYFVCGRAFQGYAGGLASVLTIAGKPWDWLGAEPWFFSGLPMDSFGVGLVIGAPPVFLFAWFGILSVGLAGLIPLGSGADRWRLGAVCASTALLSGLTFPVFAHWSWGGGWLAQLGVNFGLGRGYLDAGGAGTIHALGGLTALAITWIVGARRGKYTSEGMPMAIPGHNAVLVLFGCMVAFVGWLGLNSAGAMLFAGVGLGRVPLIAVNTLLGASASALVAAVITKLRFGKPDASLTANGWVGGLVAGSAGCAFVPPAAILIVGLVAGALVTFSVELLDLRLEVDDPGGAISVHAVGGIWGVLAVGLFGRLEAAGDGQLLAQVVGIGTLIGFVLPLTYGLNWLLNLGMPQRVAVEGEHQGMDLYELGAGAYPEFMTHTDDFMR
ncbi:MAG: ammonium transporter [Bryobacteraceae bacterium]